MPLPVIPTSDPSAKPNGLPWRLERQNKPKGPYYLLTRGPREDRESISLAYVSTPEADAALAGIEWLREHGTATGAYPTPDRLLLFMRDAPSLAARGVSEHEAKADARDRIVRLLTMVGQLILDAQELGSTLDGAALAALAPALAPDASKLPVDYRLMTLREYHDGVWKDERKKTNPDTWNRETRLWEGYILPALGGLRLRDLDPTETARTAHVHFDKLVSTATLKNGKPASGNTKRLIRAAYQACLTFAARSGHIGGVHKFFAIKGSTVRVLPEPVPLTPEEIKALLDAAEGAEGRGGDPDGGKMHRCLFAVAVGQGLRPSEARRLDWAQLDLKAGTMRVPGKKTKRSKATIPLLPLALAELEKWWKVRGEPTSGAVFTWRGAVLASDTAYKKALATAGRKAKIAQNVNPYLLRHTFATRSLQAGASREDVAAILRHTNPRMVEEHYDHAEVVTTVDAARFEAWQRS